MTNANWKIYFFILSFLNIVFFGSSDEVGPNDSGLDQTQINQNSPNPTQAGEASQGLLLIPGNETSADYVDGAAVPVPYSTNNNANNVSPNIVVTDNNGDDSDKKETVSKQPPPSLKPCNFWISILC